MNYRNCKGKDAKLALEAADITFSFGDRVLFQNVNFKLYTGEIYGLIGQNGLGKTTLCNLILQGNLGEHGEIHKFLPIVTISQLLNQEEERTVIDYLLADYNHCKEQMVQYEDMLSISDVSEQDSLLVIYQEILEKFETIGGENVPFQVNKLLNKAGLFHLKERPVSVLSGGERRLIEIIRLHLKPEYLLLLDEPETHLDIYQIMSFCSLIKSYKGCILMVSHNRYILDSCCTKTLCLSNMQVNEYSGNYSYYRKVMLSDIVAEYFYSENVQKKVNVERGIVERYEEIASKSSDPAWGRRLRAKRKQLERTEKKDPGKKEVDYKNLELNFKMCTNEKAKYLIELENVRCSIGRKELFFCSNAKVAKQDRIVIWGKNGCGKSTLIKSFLNNSNIKGIKLAGRNIGYLPQEIGSIVESNMTVKEYLYDTHKINVSDFIQMSGCMHIEENRTLESLSGGERMLLRLYLLTKANYDILLLDEPTSHLDVFTQESLQKALENCDGAFVLITHDPYWVSLLAEKIWLIDEGMLIEMDVDSFHKWLQENTIFYDSYIQFVKKQHELQQLEKKIFKALVSNDIKECKEILKQLLLMNK